MACVCQQEQFEEDGRPLSPMRQIQWERGIMKLFQMMSQDMDTLQMVILKTPSSEKAWEAVFKARDHESIITDMRAQMWTIGLSESSWPVEDS